MSNALRTPATGEIRVGDIVRIGKGRVNWTVTSVPCAAGAGIALVSDKGAYRALDTAETLTIMVREGREMLTAWLTAEMEWLEKRAADAKIAAPLTDAEMSAIETVTGATAENREHQRAADIDAVVGALDAHGADFFDVDPDSDAADAEDYDARCVACGEPIDYCIGHGEIGDPEGFAVLEAHDNDDHSNCNPRGCDDAAARDAEADGHVAYPHVPGYLIDCDACESGPCVCSEPCNEGECVASGWHARGAKFKHNAPCVSANCEHPDGAPDMESAYADAVDYVRMTRPELLDGTEESPAPVSSASDAHSAPEATSAPEPTSASGWKLVPVPRPNRAQRRAAERRQRRERKHHRKANPFGWNS